MLKAPQQKRSEATLQRILNVCEALIDQGRFEQATMQDIAKAAKVSVGTLYKRFDAKATIVEYLVTQLQTDQYERMVAELEACTHQSLADRLRFFSDLAYRSTSEYAGLLRTVTVAHLLGASPITTTTRSRSSQLIEDAATWLDTSTDSPGLDACRNACAALVFAFQYRAIYPTPDTLLGQDTYRTVIEDMAQKYLGA